MRISALLAAIVFSLPVLAVDYGELADSVDKEKAVKSVDADKLKASVKDGDVDYKKAYDSVDKTKAAESVDVDKAKSALMK